MNTLECNNYFTYVIYDIWLTNPYNITWIDDRVKLFRTVFNFTLLKKKFWSKPLLKFSQLNIEKWFVLDVLTNYSTFKMLENNIKRRKTDTWRSLKWAKGITKQHAIKSSICLWGGPKSIISMGFRSHDNDEEMDRHYSI